MKAWQFFLGWFRRRAALLVALVSWIAFSVIAYAIFRLTRDIRYAEVAQALEAVPARDFLLAVGLTAVSFGLLTRYDANALRWIGRGLKPAQYMTISFIAYAIGNTASLGALTNGAIRYRGYSRAGLAGDEVARVIAFTTLAFGLGLTVVTTLSALIFAGSLSNVLHLPASVLRGGGLTLLAVLAVVAILLRRRGLLPDAATCARQMVITVADITVSATVLYVLLPPSVAVHWPVFVGVYAIAIGLGVLSHVPAGLGVIEAVILAAIGTPDTTEGVLGALVLYRIVYHVLPLVVAAGLAIVAEWSHARRSAPVEQALRVAAYLAPSLTATLALICGVMLIFSSVIPKPAQDLQWMEGIFPVFLVESAHFLSSLLGLGLIVAARGLSQRLDGAFWMAATAATAALLFAFVKAVAPLEASLLAVFLLMLVASRKAFTRPASLFAQALTPGWIAALAIVAVSAVGILLFAYKDVAYSNDLWWQFELSDQAPRGLRAVLGVTILASVYACYSLLRPAAIRPSVPTREEMARAAAICDAQDDGDANLFRMGDKSLMFAEGGDGFLMYALRGRSWICLFGPFGTRAAQVELIWRFTETAREAGGRAVFYEIGPHLLPVCADVGLRALKMGESAAVDLTAMDLKTPLWSEQRQALRRGERDGLSLEVIPAEGVPAIMDDLRRISDSWLAHHNAREKGFALGRFDPAYLAQQPVAVLRREGAIVAFASLMTTGTRAEATVDLMRFGADAPRGAMDFLFCSLLADMQRQGYRRFTLGMAPLSGIAPSAGGPIWNDVSRAVFEHGEKLYNFRGLRAFKAKYHPEWEPRYLVTGGGISPMAALLDATMLIGGGLRGVVGK